jgi:hypothetical protein
MFASGRYVEEHQSHGEIPVVVALVLEGKAKAGRAFLLHALPAVRVSPDGFDGADYDLSEILLGSSVLVCELK